MDELFGCCHLQKEVILLIYEGCGVFFRWWMGISKDASSVISLLLQLSSQISTHSCPALFHPHLSLCSPSYHGNVPKHNHWIEIFEEVRVQYLKAKGDKQEYFENPKSMLGKEESCWVSREPVAVFMHGDLSAGEEEESTPSLMQAGIQVEWELLARQWSPSTELCFCGHRWDLGDKKAVRSKMQPLARASQREELDLQED